MVWWLAAGPLVIWGAKKIYDAVVEDDEPSYSSSSISSAKSSRTKLRKRLIRDSILKHRKSLISEAFNEEESMCVKLYGASPANTILESSGINATHNEICKTIRLLNPNYYDSGEKNDSSLSIFTDINVEVDKVLKEADEEYGSMAGINQYNSYDESDDPFVLKIKSNLKK